ncbi:MAG: fibronectin type III domain-containing protein [Flavobacteriales bacterium]|jgi:hypothetical protein|nr:fibronectin type III domain-containing protein [Flavobacteriales bacterium]
MKQLTLLLFCAVALFSCEKDNIQVPALSNITIVSYTDTTVTLSATITSTGSSGITASGFCWSLNQLPTTSGNVTSCDLVGTTITCTISNLVLDSTYYIRAFAESEAGTAYSNQQTYVAGSEPASVGFTSFNVNSTLSYQDAALSRLYLDIDGDGEDETSFNIDNYQDLSGIFVAPYNRIFVSVGHGVVTAPDIQFAINYDADSTRLCQSFILNETIDDSASYLFAAYPFLGINHILPDNIMLGDFNGAGDSYIGFKIEIDEKYHFGWIRVSLSSDFKTLEIIDGAYNNADETPIRAGEN